MDRAMLETRQSIRDYISASRKVLELGELSLQEAEALMDKVDRLVALLPHSEEK
jgi:hypothetical protein